MYSVSKLVASLNPNYETEYIVLYYLPAIQCMGRVTLVTMMQQWLPNNFSEYGEKGLQLPVVDGLALSKPNITLGEVRPLLD